MISYNISHKYSVGVDLKTDNTKTTSHARDDFASLDDRLASTCQNNTNGWSARSLLL